MTDAPALVTTAFERATAVIPDGDDWVAEIDLDWAAPTGPNGGYLAAIAARVAATVDRERTLRSLSLQYRRTAAAGPLRIELRQVRAGRRLTSVSLTARQDGQTVLGGFATLAVRGLDVVDAWAPPMPAVGPPPAIDAGSAPIDGYDRAAGLWLELPPGLPPIVNQLRIAPRIGAGPFSGRAREPGRPIVTGGWMGSPEAQRIDTAYLAQLTDFWWPPAFEVLTTPAIAPTIDLTIHLHAELPEDGLDPSAVLGHYRTAVAADGLVEEDSSLFLPDGRLLGRSRQLALLGPVTV